MSQPVPPRIRVVAVDDEPVILALVAEQLERHPSIELVGTGCNGREALQLTNRLRPDVVVLDVAMPLVNGIEAAARISASYPSTGILMLTADETQVAVKTALRAGAREYLSKLTEMDRVATAILDVAARRDARAPDRGTGFIWSFYGTKGGAGTTTLAINTAVALARLRHKVLLVDLDLLHGDCGFYLDMPQRRSGGRLLAELEELEAVDAEKVELAVRRWQPGAGEGLELWLLESPGALVAQGPRTEANLTLLLEFLASLYDYVIVDLPPGRLLEPAAVPVLDLSERLFLVHNQDLASLRGLLTLTQQLERLSFSLCKLSLLIGAVNRAEVDYREFLSAKLAAVRDVQDVPVDVEACRSAMRAGSPVVAIEPGAPLAVFVTKMVDRLLGRPERGEPAGLLERITTWVSAATRG